MAYFSNGTEGDYLDRQCSDCPIGESQCPILLVQLLHNYDQCDNEKLKEAMNILIDHKGDCQMKPIIDKSGAKRPESAEEEPKKSVRMTTIPEWNK